MIDKDSKYFSLSGDIPIGGPSTWHSIDWDQRRVVSVTMDGEQDDESLAIEHFKGSAKKVVFKYYFLWQYAQMSWKEMNLWMRLPCHPNIVPFDQVVVDELEGRIVGFTSNYVPGGNLEENKSRVFKLKWLQQLIKVVDELNLGHGIAHQDIAPRNLLINESTDSIMLFDFNFAARINCPSSGEGESYVEERNVIKGVIFTTYEIITQDDSLRSIPHEDQNLDNLELKWVTHPEVKLDHPVESYQLMLKEWRERRERDSRSGNVPRLIDWPAMPKPPQKTISLKTVQGQTTSVTVDNWYERRQDIRGRGDKVLNWERPPQRLLDNGIRVLSTGEILNC
ncbi:CBL-interacting protein kinase 2 [Fusarium oxysporum f. sp. raphani]|nr:CBL-interacting protein kinase 2 [Fusarium oxysporum f. sp. raphani]